MMPIIKFILIFILLLSSFSTFSIALYSYKKLKTNVAIAFILMMLSISIYSLGYAFELSQDSIPGIFLALKIQYLGIPFISLFWFIVALKYSGYKKLNLLKYILLILIPFITTIMLYTNKYHLLFYRNIQLSIEGPFTLALTNKGLWYYIDYAYKIILTISGTALFFNMIKKQNGFKKKQALVIFIGSVIPAIGIIVAITNIYPYSLDLTPFFLTIAVPTFGFPIFKLGMFNISPIAKDRIFEGMMDGVIVIDKKNRICDYNFAAGKLFSELGSDVLGLDYTNVLNNYSELLKIISKRKFHTGELPLQVFNEVKTFNVSLTKLFSKINIHIGYILVLHDITTQKELEKQLYEMATIDVLTNVSNRRYFFKSAIKELERLKRFKREFSLLLIDIDLFKSVNDTYGHLAGDTVLKNCAHTLKKIIRDCDTLGRYGGEEFIILLPETDKTQSNIIAERLRKEVSLLENIFEDKSIPVTISLGSSHFSFMDDRFNYSCEDILFNIIDQADKALYKAKSSGRNKVTLFSYL